MKSLSFVGKQPVLRDSARAKFSVPSRFKLVRLLVLIILCVTLTAVEFRESQGAVKPTTLYLEILFDSCKRHARVFTRRPL